MKYSFLCALYRQNRQKTFLTALLYSFPTWIDIFFYINQTAHWLAWSPAANTTFYRLIHSDYFWLIVSFNLLPLLFLFCLRQTQLILALKIWIGIAGSFFLIHAFYWPSYPITTLLIISFNLPFLNLRNKELMHTYINPMP
ncbi:MULTISPECIES: hypothetical protein [Acinetobacter]|uniref:Uncharacterized protein n=1 Tax=Acinetobacter pseudolwoffii TaxID=2053287 RepID=A0A2H9UJX2_9GAMM|nr:MULTISPECIES: hypothetical protein [Acinetobacter]MDM1341844.1 hypothetical protein [Acinetobacter pseudolwoffii]PJI31994.1 hypothetical protein CU320_11140 [Acinetobacter pseudolwoffii]